jgi:hypothetical protein
LETDTGGYGGGGLVRCALGGCRRAGDILLYAAPRTIGPFAMDATFIFVATSGDDGANLLRYRK